MKYLSLKHLLLLLVIASLSFIACNSYKKKEALSTDNTFTSSFDAAKDFVYYNNKHIALVKEKIKAKDSYFLENYAEVLKAGSEALDFKVDPVTNKKEVPPSKDMHDYISYAPYRWPDTSKPDGLPWVAIDGIINPVSRNADTDFSRKNNFF